MEQDRASTVLLHHDELEEPTVDGLLDHRQPHRRNEDSAGLTVKARLDRRVYKRGIQVSAQEMLSNSSPIPSTADGIIPSNRSDDRWNCSSDFSQTQQEALNDDKKKTCEYYSRDQTVGR